MADKSPDSTNLDRRFVLFDIDGTIVRTKSDVYRPVFEDLVRSIYGVEVSMRDFRFSGKTDRGILHEIGKNAGIAESDIEENLGTFFDGFIERLQGCLATDVIRLLPNVSGLLERLAFDERTTLALLTGNHPKAAEMKLGLHGLVEHFEFGIYGLGSCDRNDLASEALARIIQREGGDVRSEQIVVVGDSVNDVTCAKHIGARVIVTLTGSTTRAEIESLQPDYIFEDLSDTDAVMTAIYA